MGGTCGAGGRKSGSIGSGRRCRTLPAGLLDGEIDGEACRRRGENVGIARAEVEGPSQGCEGFPSAPGESAAVARLGDESAELLTPLRPPIAVSKATHNRLESLQSEILANSELGPTALRQAHEGARASARTIGAALSACVAVDAQRPELGALAAFLEQPSLFRLTMACVAPG